MMKLIGQILKFGIVGFICFFIDYIIGLGILNLIMMFGVWGEDNFRIGSQIGAAAGFTISVIINYILSFKFVFHRKEDMNRKAEFMIFILLSLVGLLINQLIIGVCTGTIYYGIAWLREHIDYNTMYTAAKIIATAIVMVYNFVTRKIFLEKKEK